MSAITNSWFFTGAIKNFGIKGTKFPRLWIIVDVPQPQAETSTLFVNIDISNDTSTKQGKQSKYVLDNLGKDKHILVQGAFIGPVKESRKNDAGEWESYERTSVRAKLAGLSILNNVPTPLNTGIVKGRVLKHVEDKLLVEDRYLVPTTNEWKSRSIPLVYTSNTNLAGKNIFATAILSSLVDDKETKVFGKVIKLFEI